jgi:hypothetical protein
LDSVFCPEEGAAARFGAESPDSPPPALAPLTPIAGLAAPDDAAALLELSLHPAASPTTKTAAKTATIRPT